MIKNLNNASSPLLTGQSVIKHLHPLQHLLKITNNKARNGK